MRRLDAGTSGGAARPLQPIDALDLPPPWPRLLAALCPEGSLRPLQWRALAEAAVVESRRNLVVSAPTASGKSLVGDLILVDALLQGRRAILLEPLRALARERVEGLRRALRGPAREHLGGPPRIRRAARDLPDNDDDLAGPQQADLIVATPERLETICRSPRRRRWLERVGAVVVDEAQLLFDPSRGPTLELLLADLLALPSPPRIALLSATLAAPDRLAHWLIPCDLVVEQNRTPPLHKQVLELERGESADQILIEELAQVLVEPDPAVLIFLYQRRDTVALAAAIDEALGPGTALAYHARLSSAARAEARETFTTGRCRCLVTTTALAAGVNLPASHVYVRDSTFPGAGELGTEALIQMLGRAGRGDRPGRGHVLVRSGSRRPPEALARELAAEALTPVESALTRAARRPRSGDELPARAVSALLARRGQDGASDRELRQALTRGLDGDQLATLAPRGLAWLERQALAFRDVDDGRGRLTVLGARGARAMLPPSHVAGLGRLFRDLLSVDPEDQLLQRWTRLDHLLVLTLLAGPDRVGAVRDSMLGQRSMLYQQWLSGPAALELMGSLGLSIEPRRPRAERVAAAQRRAERALASATVLLEHIEGVGEPRPLRWRREELIWLLSGQARLLELRSFYFHLRERCRAEADRIRRVKRALRAIRGQAFALTAALTKVARR